MKCSRCREELGNNAPHSTKLYRVLINGNYDMNDILIYNECKECHDQNKIDFEVKEAL